MNRQSMQRNGYVYVAVLFTSLLVVAVVSASLTISTSTLRRENDRGNRGDALQLAENELQRISSIIHNDSAWRSSHVSGAFTDWRNFTIDGSIVDEHSQVRYRFVDTDGFLNDNSTDPVEVTIHAKSGRSEAAVRASFDSLSQPYDVLNFALTASDDVRLEGGVISSDKQIQVNDDCSTTSSGAIVTPTLAVGGNVLVTVRGDQTAASVDIPSRDILNDYVTAGTRIPSSALPWSGGDIEFQDFLLTDQHNPISQTSSSGIYWFDAAGRKVTIENCRIEATLAIRNASVIEVKGGVNWQYAGDPDAFLVTDSPVWFKNLQSTLAEDSLNFNPAAAPYRTTFNTNTSDVFPTKLRGVLYSTNDIRVDPVDTGDPLYLTGMMVCRDLRVDGRLSIMQLDELISDPPANLSSSGTLRLVRGSVRRIPSP